MLSLRDLIFNRDSTINESNTITSDKYRDGIVEKAIQRNDKLDLLKRPTEHRRVEKRKAIKHFSSIPLLDSHVRTILPHTYVTNPEMIYYSTRSNKPNAYHPQILQFLPGMNTYLRFPQSQLSEIDVKKKILKCAFEECYYSKDYIGAAMVRCMLFSTSALIFSIFIILQLLTAMVMVFILNISCVFIF